MNAKTLIIHGWSDCSKSFKALKERLVRMGAGNVESIYFADYESREDNITLNDVVDGLNDEMKNTNSSMAAEKRGNENEFIRYKNKLVDITRQTYEIYRVFEDPDNRKYPYQQYIIHAVDDQDFPIRDFTIEFFGFNSVSRNCTNRLDGSITESVKISRRFSDCVYSIFSSIHLFSTTPSSMF